MKGKKTVYILRSTCSTILSQPSSAHIQLRYKVQPASVCLQLASIMDGFVCMCVCVCVYWGNEQEEEEEEEAPV